ncbi:endonuclease/exonuclease/phosphatase family protein [Fodinicola feengrottensis]|uniref:Endonuclease/exonuclease/phosphatase family protein n=2 Tax=Fodinicola feengrottensis TaxID=435914 RepID=A0ABN2IIJ5_9ACTN
MTGAVATVIAMRLASFNVMHGRTLSDGRIEPGRLAAAIARLNADVLGLQELDRGQPRTGGRDLTAEVATATGTGAQARFVATVSGVPGQEWEPATGDPVEIDAPTRGPEYGIGLVSRWPVKSWHVTRLSPTKLRSPVLVPGPKAQSGKLLVPSARPALIQDEPRAMLAAVIEAPFGPVTIATTHLSFVPGWNVKQLRQVFAALAELPGPHVLLGDLNMPAHGVKLAISTLGNVATPWRMLAKLPTYPSKGPRIQLDYALTDSDGELPELLHAHNPALALSDHRPLLLEFA